MILKKAVGPILENYKSFRAFQGTGSETVICGYLRSLEPMYFIVADMANMGASAADLILAERLFSTLPAHNHGRYICDFLRIGALGYQMVMDLLHLSNAIGLVITKNMNRP